MPPRAASVRKLAISYKSPKKPWKSFLVKILFTHDVTMHNTSSLAKKVVHTVFLRNRLKKTWKTPVFWWFFACSSKNHPSIVLFYCTIRFSMKNWVKNSRYFVGRNACMNAQARQSWKKLTLSGAKLSRQYFRRAFFLNLGNIRNRLRTQFWVEYTIELR